MERFEFGSATIWFAEVGELLVAHAHGTAGEVWAASRTSGESLAAACMGAMRDELSDYPRVGISHHSENAARNAYLAIEENERIERNENKGLCHCGHSLYGSDHCPLCGCEQYEAYCKLRYHDSPIGRAQCDCPHHTDY